MPTIFSYDTTVPAANNAPKNDQPVMQTNCANIAGLISVDHVNFGSSTNGYHTVIHQGPQGSDPINILGFGQTYTKTISGDQQLFYESGSGVITQLTGPNDFSAAINGYTWIPGPILIQWGSVASTSSDPSINFVSAGNINFPNNIFNIQVTRSHGSSSPGDTFQFWVRTSSVSTTGFQIINGDGHSWAYFWYAIGN